MDPHKRPRDSPPRPDRNQRVKVTPDSPDRDNTTPMSQPVSATTIGILDDSTSPTANPISLTPVANATQSPAEGTTLPLTRRHNAVFVKDHDAMDKAVVQWLSFSCPPADTLLYMIIVGCPEIQKKSTTKLDPRQYITQLLTDYPQLTSMLNDCWKEQKFESIRTLEIFWPEDGGEVADSSNTEESAVPHALSVKATELAWKQEFKGKAQDALWDYIIAHLKPSSGKQSHYAQYAAIVQSSGMGKSRVVDEFSKEHFVIPMNLRALGRGGFPASDESAHHYWSVHMKDQQLALIRSHAFLMALFYRTKEAVEDLYREGADESTIAAMFRAYMTEGQTMASQGPKRVEFYKDVVAHANDLLEKGKRVVNVDEFKTVTFVTTEGSTAVTISEAALELDHCIRRSRNPKYRQPAFTIAFDEAHTLIPDQQSRWSTFSELRRALRSLLATLDTFTLFLSTTGKVSQFTPSQEEDNSERVLRGDLVLIDPFTDLGFDHFAEKIDDWNGSWTLEKVVTNAHMVTLGRPVFATRYYPEGISAIPKGITDQGLALIRQHIVPFAAQKLINMSVFRSQPLRLEQQLACLSHRLPIEFMSSTYTGLRQQKAQVQAHLRVVLKIEDGFRTMETVCPSEPILAEGAFSVMEWDSFDAPKVLQSVLNGFAVHQGNRGELVALLLLLIARDNAVRKVVKVLEELEPGSKDNDLITARTRVISVCGFLEELFALPGPATKAAHASKGEKEDILHENILFAGPSVFKLESERGRPLKETFADAKLHFNHFIKIHDWSLLHRKFLLFFASRGIAVLCANSQAGIDAFIPYMFKGSAMKTDNVGVILLQFKNDQRYTMTINPVLLDAMDPYDLGLFKEEKDAVVPIIRIVLALAGRTTCLKARPPPPPPSPPPPETETSQSEAWKAILPGTDDNSKTKKLKKSTAADTTPPAELTLPDADQTSAPGSKEGKKPKEPRKRFTAYDIWCSGLKSDVYAAINKSNEEIWASILWASQRWQQTYQAGDEAATQLRKSQNPGAATDREFFSQWISKDLLKTAIKNI